MGNYQIASLLGAASGSMVAQFLIYVICRSIFKSKAKTAIIVACILGILANGPIVAPLAWMLAGIIYLIVRLIKKFIATKVWNKPQRQKVTTNEEKFQKQDNRTQDVQMTQLDNAAQNEEYWAFVSFVYSKVKQTSIFKLWRKEQFDCQFGKCTICGKPMDRRYTQVDHIKPRYKYGTNYSDNLALTHKKCNEDKGAKTGYVRPGWFKDNKYSKELDEKVYELTEETRKEYPAKFPDELFKRP